MLGCQSIGLGFDPRHWPGCTGHDTMGVTEHHRPSMQWHYHINQMISFQDKLTLLAVLSDVRISAGAVVVIFSVT